MKRARQSLFSTDKIKILAYPIETIIAEKLQTIYFRGFLNSRSKDYYDLFILSKLKRDEIDKALLLQACEKTFHKRTTDFSFEKIASMLDSLTNDKSFKTRWDAYSKKNTYVQGISFKDTISEIQKFLTWIA